MLKSLNSLPSVFFHDFIQNLLVWKKSLHKHHLNVKQFTFKSGLHFVGPDLDLNCLQLSADRELKAKKVTAYRILPKLLIHLCLHIGTFFFLSLSNFLHANNSALFDSFQCSDNQ